MIQNTSACLPKTNNKIQFKTIFLKAFYVLLFHLTILSCTGYEEKKIPTIQSEDSDFKEKVDSLFKHKMPSFSGRILLATSKMESIVYDKSYGYADFDLEIPYEPHIANDIASLSKQFTAAAILKMQEKQVLRISDPLSNYFDNLPKNKGEITLHQLLTHSAGLPLYSGKDAVVTSKEDFFQWFQDVELIAEPGTEYNYSNPGYTMLTLLLEKLNKQSHEDILRDLFFDELGLNATGYRFPKNPLAVSYDNGKRIGTPTELPWAPDGPYWNLRGGGGIISTLDDLFIWYKKLYQGNVLSENSTNQMFSKHVPENENSWYGYGWHIIEDEKGTWIDHSGSDGYKFTDIRYFKTHDLLLIFTTNNFNIDEVKTIVQEVPIIYGIQKENP